jgi:phytoene dehydrogenase-like protein
MKTDTNGSSIIIIGGGFAGLSAGIYSQMNGYETQIFEMHDQAGGLCTSWNRKGFTIDGCIHWLVGSSPYSSMYEYWEEVGLVQNREFIDSDEYMRFEGSDGRTLIFYTNIDQLEKHLLEFSPKDEEPIHEFIEGIKMCLPFDLPSKRVPYLKRLSGKIKLWISFITKGKKMKWWMNTTAQEFSAKFKDPVLREAFLEIWLPDFSMFFMLFTFAWLHNKNAGYPLGGSTPLSEALEARYKDLGGIIHYGKKVDKIITEGDKAVGIRLEEGTDYHASKIISAADGYSTIFKMLDGKFIDDKISEQYKKWKLFPSLIFIGVGVNRTFKEVPRTVSGFSFPLQKPLEIGDKIRDRIGVHIYNQDPAMAPEGKSVMTIMFESDYDYWKKMSGDKSGYKKKKEEIGNIVVSLLEQRFPGISSQVEMIDVSTPLTFERYTGNWKGSFEGWLITPDNSNVVMKPLSQSLPGLENFYLCGQWVEPGGGLPSGVMSARRLLKSICNKDGKKFNTSITFTGV